VKYFWGYWLLFIVLTVIFNPEKNGSNVVTFGAYKNIAFILFCFVYICFHIYVIKVLWKAFNNQKLLLIFFMFCSLIMILFYFLVGISRMIELI